MRGKLHRRNLLRLGGQSALGLALGGLLPRAASASIQPKADACVLVFLNGGMSHLDTVDMKPQQPPEIRGEFQPIATSVAGTIVCEHLPKLARQMHRLAVVRTVGFEGRLGNHSPACYHMLTGHEPLGDDAVLAPPRVSDQPAMGAVVSRVRPSPSAVPSFVITPDVLYENVFLTPGQFAGWLGSRDEAFLLNGDPNLPDFAVPALSLNADLPNMRLQNRQSLREELNSLHADLGSTARSRSFERSYKRAFDMLASSRMKRALEIESESAATRERYGRSKFGQSVLLARRLIEAEVRFVNVHWPNVGGGQNWDTHSNGFDRLKNTLLPPMDTAVSALLDDLADRGRLERTIVAVVTEFGRAPRIGQTLQNAAGHAGRDHWSNCFSVLLAGGGIPGGVLYGTSDSLGAYADRLPLRPADIVATILHAFGIDPHQMIEDLEGRPHVLTNGTPLDWDLA